MCHEFEFECWIFIRIWNRMRNSKLILGDKKKKKYLRKKSRSRKIERKKNLKSKCCKKHRFFIPVSELRVMAVIPKSDQQSIKVYIKKITKIFPAKNV